MRSREGATRAAVAVSGLLALLPVASWAQAKAVSAAPAAPGATASTPADVAALAEEIAVLRAVKPLRATAEQWSALAAAVSAGQERLAQQAKTDTQALALLRNPVIRARQQLLPPEVNLNDPQLATALQADQQVTLAQRAAEQNQSRVRDELAASLRQQLEALLTPAQVSAAVDQGRGLLVVERAQQEQQRQQRAQQFQRAMGAAGATGRGPGGPGGGPGGPGGGPGGRGGPQGMLGMLERLRSADSDTYQRMSNRMARQFGDEGTPGYQNALSMFDQMRSMPDRQFRRQSGSLAQQFTAAMSAARSPANAAYSISPQNALETWVRRYLLSPQAPTALKELAGGK